MGFNLMGLPSSNLLHSCWTWPFIVDFRINSMVDLSQRCNKLPGRVSLQCLHNWLVVVSTLWKIWVRQLGWWNPQYFSENKSHVPGTTNQTTSWNKVLTVNEFFKVPTKFFARLISNLILSVPLADSLVMTTPYRTWGHGHWKFVSFAMKNMIMFRTKKCWLPVGIYRLQVA